MGMQVAKEMMPAVERGCAPVYFVNGLVRVDHLPGGNMMFTFYRHDAGRREIEVKLICAKVEVEPMRRQTDLAMAGFQVVEEEVGMALM